MSWAANTSGTITKVLRFVSLDIPEGEQKEGLAIQIIQKKLMNGNIPNLAKHLNIKIQGSWANSRKNSKKSTSRTIIVKVHRTKDKR